MGARVQCIGECSQLPLLQNTTTRSDEILPVRQINVIVVSDLSGSVEVSHHLEGGIKLARVRLAVEFVWVLGCWLRGLV